MCLRSLILLSHILTIYSIFLEIMDALILIVLWSVLKKDHLKIISLNRVLEINKLIIGVLELLFTSYFSENCL